MSGASLLLRFKPCSVYAHPLGVSQNDENGKVDDNNSIVHIQTYSVVVYYTKNPRRIANGCTEIYGRVRISARAYSLSDFLDALHRRREHLRRLALRTVTPRMCRIVMDLDDKAIRPDSRGTDRH